MTKKIKAPSRTANHNVPRVPTEPPIDSLQVKRLKVESLELVNGEGETRARLFTRGPRTVFCLEGSESRTIQMVADQATGEIGFRILDHGNDFYPVSLGFTDIANPETPALEIGEPYDDGRGRLHLALKDDCSRPLISMKDANGARATLRLKTDGSIEVACHPTAEDEAADNDEEDEDAADDGSAQPAWVQKFCEALAVAFETKEFPVEAFNTLGDLIVEIYDDCRGAVGMAFEARHFMPRALAYAHLVDKELAGEKKKAWMQPAGEQSRERFAFVGQALAEVIEDQAAPVFIRNRLTDAVNAITHDSRKNLAADYLKGDFAADCEQQADK